jgi:LPXTG-site transpeptidase (sortase) family protein
MSLRPAVLGLLVVLPLAGCAGGAAEPAAPPAVRASPSPVAPSSAPSIPAVSTRPRPAPVPTVRATLRPAAQEAPAPHRFVAADLGIDLPVVPVGVDDVGLMRLPETVREVAWYEYSARPGGPSGTTVLAGHVDTRADGLGPFARLRELDEGDSLGVEVEGTTRRYVVTSVEKVAKSEVPLDQVFRRDGRHELKVITCGGAFSRRTGYRDNVIVTAVPG